jgi:hypothetical protein
MIGRFFVLVAVGIGFLPQSHSFAAEQVDFVQSPSVLFNDTREASWRVLRDQLRTWGAYRSVKLVGSPSFGMPWMVRTYEGECGKAEINAVRLEKDPFAEMQRVRNLGRRDTGSFDYTYGEVDYEKVKNQLNIPQTEWEASIDTFTFQALENAWVSVLRYTSSLHPEYLVMDGTGYYAAVTIPGLGGLYGTVGSPPEGTRAAMLVVLADHMLDYAQKPTPEKRRRLLTEAESVTKKAGGTGAGYKGPEAPQQGNPRLSCIERPKESEVVFGNRISPEWRTRIMNALRQYNGGFEYSHKMCLKKEPSIPEGTIWFSFEISASGDVDNAKVDSSTINSDVLHKALLEKIAKVKFDNSDKQRTTVKFPMHLHKRS